MTFAADDGFGILYLRSDKVRFDLGGETIDTARINSGSLFVGSGAGHTGLLIVTNGTLNPEKHYQIGVSGGTGVLINDGADFRGGNLNLSNAGGTGTYLVRNGGKHTGINGATIGWSLAATMIITNAGSYVEVNGTYLKNDSRLYIGAETHMRHARGIGVYDTSVVTVEGELRLVKASYYGPMEANLFIDGGILEGSGFCANVGSNPEANPFDTLNRGTIRPGGSNTVGTLTIGPTLYTQTTGKLEFEIGGAQPGMYDRLVLHGDVTLDADQAVCEVTFIDGYAPEGGETFDLFDFDALTGSFATLTLPALDPGLAWDTSDWYVSGLLKVEIVPSTGTLLMIF